MRVTVAEEIRVMLARRRMSGAELARQIGQTQPYLSRRLTGEVAIDVDDLAKIAQVLGVSPTALIGAGITEGYGVSPAQRQHRKHTAPKPRAAAHRRPVGRTDPDRPQLIRSANRR